MTAQLEDNQIKSLALLLLSTMCLSYSGYQTFQGYQTDMGFGNALVLALILTLAMLVLSFTLRSELKGSGSERKIIGILALYMVAASFSFIGNFNSFFNALLRDTVIRDEVQEKMVLLQTMRTKANEVLTDNSVEVMRSKIIAGIDQFKSQLQNQMEPGLGSKAELVLKEIENVLGQNITRLRGNDNSEAALKAMGKQYEEMILKTLEKSPIIALRGTFEKERVKKEINQSITLHLKELDDASQKMTAADGDARDTARMAIQRSISAYKTAGAEIRRYYPEFIYNTELSLKNANLGRISHSISSAASNLANMQTWIAVILALLIELFVPALVFGLTQRGGPQTDSFFTKPSLDRM